MSAKFPLPGRMCRGVFLFVLTGVLFGSGAEAEGPRRFRWQAKEWRPVPQLMSMVARLSPSSLGGERRAGAERIVSGPQMLGPARVDETWRQTVSYPGGSIVYAAGEIYDELPVEWLARLQRMEALSPQAEVWAQDRSEAFRHARVRSPSELRFRMGKEPMAYWQFEFLPKTEDRVFFLRLGENGEFLEEGILPVAEVDGRARIYPEGPVRSALSEVPLFGLLGDGTVNGTRVRVSSALNIEALAPDLVFLFPEDDRRFEFAQAYYSVDRALRWMQEKLGVSLSSPLALRLHVGTNGVSNAAFYHRNTVYLGTGDGLLYKDLLKDPSVAIHETIHALIDAYAGLGSEGEEGALNEGFADFFTALILMNPRLGESSFRQGPYRRTLEHDWRLDLSQGMYRNGSVIAATFWDLNFLGDERLAQFAFRTMTRLGRGARLDDFLPAMLSASAGILRPEEEELVWRLVRERGWVVLP